MNIIDEWLDSEGAKQDAEKFLKTACLIQGRKCGKTAFALYQMKKYLEDHPDATVVMPYHHGYSYVKELMNSVYWNKKPPHDDTLDAIRYAIEEFEIKQREEMLEKAKLNRDEIKEMLNNSCYGICWPSELIESCERIDKYRKEEKSMENICSYTYNHNLTGKIIKAGDIYYVIGNYEVESEDDYEASDYVSKHLYAYEVPKTGDVDKVVRIVKTRSREFLKGNLRECKLCYYIYYGDGSIVIPGGFVFVNKKEEETKDMSRTKALKNIVGSDIYVKKDDNIMYVGRGESLEFNAYNGEISGVVSFVADDEPLEDELRKISRSFIKKVIFNKPATIVFWRDGSKTIVKMNGKDKKFDPEKGLAMAIAKKCLGNEGNYYNTFKHYLKKVKTESVCGEKVKTITLPEELAYDVMQFLKEKMNVVSPSETVLNSFCGEKSDDINSVRIAPETIEEVKRVDDIDGDGPLMPL